MGMYPRSDADILSNPRGLNAPFFVLPQSVQAITTLCLFDTAYDTMYNKTEGVNMSQLDKLIQRIQELDKNMRFEELRKILEYYGYRMEQPRRGGSHYTFRKEGSPSITIPKASFIRMPYILMVREVVEANEHERS